MKKLSKIKMQDALVLENHEMKKILGGSDNNGCDAPSGYVCTDEPCALIVSGTLVSGRCKWTTTPIGRLCGYVAGSTSGSLISLLWL